MKRRESNSQSLGDVIQEIVRANRLKRGLTMVELRKEWENLLGKPVANHTTRIEVNKKVLHVHLDSSVVREELHYNRAQILERLQEQFGPDFVTEIRLY